MTSQQHYDLDAIRDRVSLVALVGKRVKLRRAGRGFKGLCPFHEEKSPSFSVSDERGFYHCFGCGAHGGVFDWVMFTEGVGLAEAIRMLAEDRELIGAAAPAPRRIERADAAMQLVDSTEVGAWLWRTALPARGTIVEAWLRSRSLDPAAVANGLRRLRFHPRACVVPWRIGAAEGDAPVRAPAMIAAMQAPDGSVQGVHATYLACDGRSKARLTWRDGSAMPSRKMWGSLTGNAVWLTGDPPGGSAGHPLVVGEGIETVWAFVQRHGRPVRAAAALSLDNLEGFPALTPAGALPLWRVRPDFERPCFTIPDAGDVLVLVDADMKPLRDRRVQRARGGRWELATLDGAARAQLCADLATQQWRHAGARRVQAVRPPAGMDFNDAVREAVA